MHRAIAAKCYQRKLARIAATFGGDSAQGTERIRVGNPVDSFGGADDGQTERLGNAVVDRALRCFQINGDIAVRQLAGADVAQDNVGIG